jgi:hypothetical protein
MPINAHPPVISGNSSGTAPDARILAHSHDSVVIEPDPIELDARLRVSGDHLCGELRLPDGRRIAFESWLGLIGALEAARSNEPPGDDRPVSG